MEKSYKYLGYFFALLIPLIFAGIYKSYFQPFPNFNPDFTFYLHIHALLAALWVLMLIIQPFLMINKKVKLHRTIGKLSYVLFPLLILSFIPQILKRYTEGSNAFLFFPIADGIFLTLFYALAIYYRKKAAKHMRYMIRIGFIGTHRGPHGAILVWME